MKQNNRHKNRTERKEELESRWKLVEERRRVYSNTQTHTHTLQVRMNRFSVHNWR